MDPQSVLNELLTDYGDLPYAELAAITAIQRAAGLVHQSLHWRTRGPLFYSDHLLFERVYNKVNDTVDALAEKTIGLGSYHLMDPLTQSNQISALVQYLCADTTPDAQASFYPNFSHAIEVQCVTLITLAKNALEAKGQLTNGLDNQLQGILDDHEQLIYLLKQRTEAA